MYFGVKVLFCKQKFEKELFAISALKGKQKRDTPATVIRLSTTQPSCGTELLNYSKIPSLVLALLFFRLDNLITFAMVSYSVSPSACAKIIVFLFFF